MCAENGTNYETLVKLANMNKQNYYVKIGFIDWKEYPKWLPSQNTMIYFQCNWLTIGFTSDGKIYTLNSDGQWVKSPYITIDDIGN